jgi:hypothetical protein
MEVYNTLSRGDPELSKGVIIKVKSDKSLPDDQSNDPMNDWVYVKWNEYGDPKIQRAWTVNELPSTQKSLFAASPEFRKGMRVKCGQLGQYGTVINVVNKEKNIVKVKMDDGHIVPFFGVFLYPVGDPQESLFDEGMSVDPQDDLMFDELAKLEKQGLASIRHYATHIYIDGIGTLEEGMDVLALVGGYGIRGRITKIDKNKEKPNLSTVWLDDGRGVRADMIRTLQRRLL